MRFSWKTFAGVLVGMLLAQAVMRFADIGTGLSIGVAVGIAVAVTLVLSGSKDRGSR